MYMNFFERVKQLAKEHNVTIKELILSLEINYDTYNSCRQYGNLPRADDAVKIATALGTSVEYLVTGIEQKQPELPPELETDIRRLTRWINK